MKLALNGALTIGTLDGANIEIREQVGAENIFIFGLTADEVAAATLAATRRARSWRANPSCKRTLDMIDSGFFSPGNLADGQADRRSAAVATASRSACSPISRAYAEAQDAVDALYLQPDEWSRRTAATNALNRWACSRAIAASREYAERIWHIKPVL